MIYNFHFINYNSVYDLEAEFKKLQIKSYCYGFYTAENVIKYGKANDLEWKQNIWGNRIIRQADAFNGWLFERYTGCSSKNKFKEQLIDHKCYFHKDYVSVTVFDYTNKFANLSKKETDEKLLIIEGNLVNDHIDKYDCKPICNIAKTKGEVAINRFNACLSF